MKQKHGRTVDREHFTMLHHELSTSLQFPRKFSAFRGIFLMIEKIKTHQQLESLTDTMDVH